MGAGAGSVNFWASRKIAASGLVGQLVSTVIGGVAAAPSGVAFWDAGTMATRLYAGSGLRLLSPVQALLSWLNPSLLNFGDLNLLGLANPLASLAPKVLLYGGVAGWTSDQTIMWGTTLSDPSSGQTIMWGTSDTTDGTTIMWGTALIAEDPQ